MDNQNRKLELLGNAPIPKALLAMGIPTMIGMLINALYNLVDAYFVGGLGESQMAAISVVYPLGQVVVGLGLLFGNGAASYISRLLGQRNKDQANKVASTALYSSLVVGAIMIVLSILFLNPILRLLGATESVLPYAATYAGIYIVSCIFNVFNVTMNNIVTSEGAAKTTMCALLLGAVLNIGLDPLFIYTFNFGVAGAAIATAISQVVSTLVYLFYIFRQKSAFQFRIKDCTFSKEILSEIFKIGVPTLVFQLLTSISISLINNAAGNYGDSAIAGMGVVTRLISMGSLTVFGFIKGFQPIAGYSYGAKKFDRLRTAIKISIYFLCDRRFIIQSVFYDHCFTVYNWKHRNDSHWSFLFKSKRYYIYAVWILHGIFLFIPCSWKRKRRVYSWSLPTRYLLHSRYLNFSIYMGIKRYFICTADCRCSLCTYYSIYGNPFA